MEWSSTWQRSPELIRLCMKRQLWTVQPNGKETKHITMPCIKPVLIMMLILDAGKIFYSDFGLFYQATGGIPASLYNVASTFDTYIYKAIQSSAPIGKTAMASFFQSVCCCATILLTNWLVKKLMKTARLYRG